MSREAKWGLGEQEKLRVGEVEWFCLAREAFAMSAKQMSEAFTFGQGGC